MLKIKTLEDFIGEIDKIMHTEGLSVMESICEYAEKNDICYKKLVPFIEASYKDVIRDEAENRNMMKRHNAKLPI
jgi:hypothetical protein